MKLSRSTGIGAVCAVLFGSDAFAQSVYVDFGEGTPPSSSYAAAASAPGYWNALPIPINAAPLLGLQGQATALVFTTDGCDTNWQQFPNTSGDDEALLDDWFNGDCNLSTERVTITGLESGTYRLYLYPIGGVHGTASAQVDVSPPVGVDANASLTAQGAFPGTYSGWQVGIAVLHVAQPNSMLSFTFVSNSNAGLSGMQLERFEEPSATGTAYCFGDGSGALCPCFNDGAFGRGCGNLLYPNGARLTASGTASVSADTLVLSASSMSGAQSWYFQATAQAADPLGYGILCVGGSLIRIGQKGLTNGSSMNPSGVDFPISLKGAIPPAGGTRHYQVSYRQANPPCSPPPTSNTNRTNGLTIVWTP
jgi:hypothetical protein